MISFAKKTCPYCEANCGVVATIEDNQVIAIKGNGDDKYSHGYVCAKSQAMLGLNRDPDVLRMPLKRTGSRFEEISWQEAFDIAGQALLGIRNQHGAEAIATYLGNPGGHSPDLLIFGGLLASAVGSTQFYTAASIDAFPSLLANASMLGDIGLNPLPDIDRLSFLLVIGANPMVSNGSLWSVPGLPKALGKMRARGGRMIVVDPRKTETAEQADEHIAIHPASDALLLLALIHTFFDEGLVSLGRLTPMVRNLDALQRLANGYPPESIAVETGIESARIRQLAREIATAQGAAVYGRIGASCQPFGSVCAWLIGCLNILSGNLDREGGLIFSKPVVPNLFYSAPFVGDQPPYGRYYTRVRKLQEIGGQLPAAALAEEIEGDETGRIRALICIAGNPARSFPNSPRIEGALASLDFMVAIDPYLNETSSHADIIIPPLDTLCKPSFTFLFSAFMPHSFVRYAQPVLPKPHDRPSDGDIAIELAARLLDKPRAEVEQAHLMALVTQAMAMFDYDGELTPDVIFARLDGATGSEKIFDLLVRLGDFGDRFGMRPEGLSLAKVRQEPDGIMLGAAPAGRLPGLIRTPDRMIDLAPAAIADDLRRLNDWRREGRFAPPMPQAGRFLLFGRRDRRSMNSWLHNVETLAKGPERFQLLMHPDDAAVLGIRDGDRADMSTAGNSITVSVQLSDTVRSGSVSLPHGWGHYAERSRTQVASSRPGPNFNILTDEGELDAPSGNAVYNGIAVTIRPVAADAGVREASGNAVAPA
ncbi:molybdopterin-dependent oxidoreductase [Sphingobium sp. EM0848]|uniref:molybdopterin-dependent oxidoreductase n=1 Tax=Sphingobium sp. EM0848 TaxID=2743473 RepID=UPI00159CB842|nr:molybdopterin-dependent oxidoreductase [Sphingobium sp. EM0848]